MSDTFKTDRRRSGHIERRKWNRAMNASSYGKGPSPDALPETVLKRPRYDGVIPRRGCNRRYYAAIKVLDRRIRRKQLKEQDRLTSLD
jgi:hypothetical protein